MSDSVTAALVSGVLAPVLLTAAQTMLKKKRERSIEREERLLVFYENWARVRSIVATGAGLPEDRSKILESLDRFPTVAVSHDDVEEDRPVLSPVLVEFFQPKTFYSWFIRSLALTVWLATFLITVLTAIQKGPALWKKFAADPSLDLVPSVFVWSALALALVGVSNWAERRFHASSRRRFERRQTLSSVLESVQREKGIG